MSRIGPLRFLRTLREERRAHGWKGLWKKRGWKLLLLVVAFYLIRDLALYVLIPVAVIVGITS